MKQNRSLIIAIVLCVLQAALTVLLGVGNVSLTEQLNLDELSLLAITALLIVVLTAGTVRALALPRPKDEEALFAFPLHWSTFFPLGLISGLVLALALVRLLGGGSGDESIHAYEIVGLIVGVLVVLIMGFTRDPLLGAAFGVGYGVALPSVILLLDPSNQMGPTYGGILGVMLVSAAVVIVGGRYVRIQIVD